VKILKRVTKLCLWLVVVLFIGALLLRGIGIYTDETPIDEQGLLTLPEVAKGDNAYYVIDFFDQDDFDSSLNYLADGLIENWDSEKARALIESHQDKLNSVTAAASKPRFKSAFPSATELPNYAGMGFLSKLNLLKAKSLVDQQHWQTATEHIVSGLRFNCLIQKDANATLVAYLVGVAYQSLYLSYIEELVVNKELPESELLRLLDELSTYGDFHNDGFELVWSGENKYSRSFMQSEVNQSFSERLESAEYLRSLGSENNLESLGELMFASAWLAIPEYIIHPNKLNNVVSAQWQEAQEKSASLCFELSQQNLSSSNNEKPSLWRLLLPNGIGEAYYQGHSADLNHYFNRRCGANAHIGATRLTLAIAQYERVKRTEISRLNQLVPEFISVLPIDPFSGEPIKLNASERLLYSYGANLRDDGGSADALYSSECHRRQACFENPSFSLKPITQSKPN